MDTVLDRLLDWLLGGAVARRIARQVEQRTRELTAHIARTGVALGGAHMHLFFQDRELRYLAPTAPHGMDGAPLIGRNPSRRTISWRRWTRPEWRE